MQRFRVIKLPFFMNYLDNYPTNLMPVGNAKGLMDFFMGYVNNCNESIVTTEFITIDEQECLFVRFSPITSSDSTKMKLFANVCLSCYDYNRNTTNALINKMIDEHVISLKDNKKDFTFEILDEKKGEKYSLNTHTNAFLVGMTENVENYEFILKFVLAE